MTFANALRRIIGEDLHSRAEGDPGLAVLRAYREYQRRQRQAEEEAFRLCAMDLIAELKVAWR